MLDGYQTWQFIPPGVYPGGYYAADTVMPTAVPYPTMQPSSPTAMMLPMVAYPDYPTSPLYQVQPTYGQPSAYPETSYVIDSQAFFYQTYRSPRYGYK
jgi:hypothetical protein